VTAIALLASAVQCEYSLSQLHSTSTDASEELLKVNVYSGSREANIHHVSVQNGCLPQQCPLHAAAAALPHLPYFLEYKLGLKYKPGLKYRPGSDVVVLIEAGPEYKPGLKYKPESWFTYWSSLTGLYCLCVIRERHDHEAINILASLFQIANLNLSLTFQQTCLLSLWNTHMLHSYS